MAMGADKKNIENKASQMNAKKKEKRGVKKKKLNPWVGGRSSQDFGGDGRKMEGERSYRSAQKV